MNTLYQQTECLFYIKWKARFSDKFDPHICKVGWRKAAMGVVYVCLYLSVVGGNTFFFHPESPNAQIIWAFKLQNQNRENNYGWKFIIIS